MMTNAVFFATHHAVAHKRPQSTFPNVEIEIRMYMSIMVSNCSGERSFTKMALIKNKLCEALWCSGYSLWCSAGQNSEGDEPVDDNECEKKDIGESLYRRPVANGPLGGPGGRLPLERTVHILHTNCLHALSIFRPALCMKFGR